MIEHPMIDPPDDTPMRECDDCGEWMQWSVEGDEDGPYLAFWCTCENAA